MKNQLINVSTGLLASTLALVVASAADTRRLTPETQSVTLPPQ